MTRTHLRRSRPAAVSAALAALAVVVATLLAPTPAFADGEKIVFSDDFSRSSADGWGLSSSGAPWSSWSNQKGALSVSDGTAAMSLAPAQSAVARTSATAHDVSAKATVRLTASSGNAYYSFVLRSQTDGSAYRVRLQTNATGAATLALSRMNGKAETALAKVSTGVSILGSAAQTFSATITGTGPVVVEARLSSGNSGAPQLVYSDDSAQRIGAAGGVAFGGFLADTATGNTSLVVDDLVVADNAGKLSSTAASTPAATTSPTPTPTPTPTQTATPTATAAPAAQTGNVASSTSSRGARTVGSTAFTVPADALYVDGSSTSAKQDGSVGSPYRSVQSAVDASPGGSTIVIRRGVYHEQVVVPYEKPLTIQSYPNEEVWFDGSTPVTDWVASGSTWIAGNWGARFSSDMDGETSRYLNASYPMASHPDQVFIDGKAQRQVGSAAEVVPGTFAVDYNNKKIILGSNPAGKSVRASDLGQAFNISSPGTTLQGVGVRRYATSYALRGAIRMQNVKSTLRDVVITQNATIGLSLTNADSLVERVTAQENGMLGMGMNLAHNLVIRDSVISDNNVEQFKKAPVAGGAKITSSKNVTVSNSDVSNNVGMGLWFDVASYDVKVVGVRANNNTATQILVELSAKVLLMNNQTLGGEQGVCIFNASNVRVLNSDFGENSLHSLKLAQDTRRYASSGLNSSYLRSSGVESEMTWIVKDILVANNVFGSGGYFSIRAMDGKSNRAVDTWNLTITGNLFNNKSAGGPTMVSWGLGDNKSEVKYNTPDALAQAKNTSWKNAMTSTKRTLAEMAAERQSNTNVVMTLPSDAASLAGWSSTTKRLGSDR